MHIIVCLDSKNGMSFAGRRQSRDKLQIAKMLETVGGKKLYVSEYTARLFETLPQNVTVAENFWVLAQPGDYCFIETEDILPLTVEDIIVYKWNRVYPSDKKFDTGLLLNKTLVSASDFPGNSHEKITEEIYR